MAEAPKRFKKRDDKFGAARRRRTCSFCGDKRGVIDYKDVATLRKFVSDRGKIRSRRITGVSVQEQRLIARAVKNAREMALMPYAGAGRN